VNWLKKLKKAKDSASCNNLINKKYQSTLGKVTSLEHILLMQFCKNCRFPRGHLDPVSLIHGFLGQPKQHLGQVSHFFPNQLMVEAAEKYHPYNCSAFTCYSQHKCASEMTSQSLHLMPIFNIIFTYLLFYPPSFTFLVPAHPGSPGHSVGGRKNGTVKMVVVVVVVVVVVTSLLLSNQLKITCCLPERRCCGAYEKLKITAILLHFCKFLLNANIDLKSN